MAKTKVIKGAENNATTNPVNLVDITPTSKPVKNKK